MSITGTTLAASFALNDDTFKATSATGATAGGICRIDDEFMLVGSIDGVSIKVKRRGDQGTAAVAHNILAPVVFCLATDLPGLGKTELVQTPSNRDLVTIGANGVIPAPQRDTVYRIIKGSALASSTFADPTKAMDGIRVTFIGDTDFAHVVTTVSAQDGTTGLHTTLTSPAFKGGSITLEAVQGLWLVVSNQLWVIT